MPSNQFAEQKRCFSFIDTILMKKLKDLEEGISYNLLVRDCLINYGISKKSIENFIKKYYEEEGIIIIKAGVITCSAQE